MKSMIKLIGIALLFLTLACSRQVPVNNIDRTPKESEADAAFANVYQSLDGSWRGKFLIYEDTARGPKQPGRLQNLTKDMLGTLPLRESSAIDVEQQYQSLSPYFQTVRITDHYPESGQTVTSEGVNKVQDGKMWCVVRKPDETVIHEGALAAPQTITWQRSESDPQRVEYFWETVGAETYEIIGWGYYDGDDLELMPRFWFYGLYQRQ